MNMEKDMFVLFETPKAFYLFDGNKNKILELDEEIYSSLKKYKQGNIDEQNKNVIKKLRSRGFCEESYVKNIMHPETKFLSGYIENKLGNLYLQVTQACNLRCSYCPYSGMYNNRRHINKRLSFDTAKLAVDFYFKHSNNTLEPSIGFYGGEPLLEYDLIKQIVGYVKKNYPDKNVSFPLTTNGTLLSDDVVDFLVLNNFNLTISLDGPKTYHDKNRVFGNGKGSHDLIMKNLKKIKEKYPEYYNSIGFNSVAAPNIEYERLIDFYEKNTLTKGNIYSWSILSDTYIDEPVKYPKDYFLLHDYEKFIAMLLSIKKTTKCDISASALQWKGLVAERYRQLRKFGTISADSHPGGPCVPGKNRLFMDVDGNFFPCEKVSENSKIMKIGNIYEGINVEKASKILNVAKCSEEECKNCWCFCNCSQCAANADDLSNIPSKEKRLKNCSRIKHETIEVLKDICFLMENHYDFQERVIQDE